MKMKELPKAPIQIQRDELLTKIAELQKELTNKDNIIANLRSDLNAKDQNLAQKNNTINNLQAELNLKTQVISEKDTMASNIQNDYTQIQSALLLKDKEIENRTNVISSLENTIKILEETIKDLKIDKDDLKSDKLKLVNEIEILKINQISFDDINSSFKIESKIEPSVKQGLVTKILEKGNTVESVYPSNNESKVLESIVLSGDLEEI